MGYIVRSSTVYKVNIQQGFQAPPEKTFGPSNLPKTPFQKVFARFWYIYIIDIFRLKYPRPKLQLDNVTLSETNSSPLKLGHPKTKNIIFQASVCKLLVSGRVYRPGHPTLPPLPTHPTHPALTRPSPA